MHNYLEPGAVIADTSIPNRDVLASIAISLKRIADMMAAEKAEIDAITAAFQHTGGA